MSRDGGGRQGTIEDGRERVRTAENGGGLRGRPGIARVMSHDVKRIRLEVHDFSLASTGGPSAGTTAPYSPSGPHPPPGRSAS